MHCGRSFYCFINVFGRGSRYSNFVNFGSIFNNANSGTSWAGNIRQGTLGISIPTGMSNTNPNLALNSEGYYGLSSTSPVNNANVSFPTILNIANIEKGILGNPIIAAISNKDIFYNTITEQFENETLGSLGFTFEELINIWQTNLCYDLVQNSKQLDDEIWDLEEPELNTYLNRFTDVWTNLALALPTIYEEELSSYYFSIKGTSEGWDKIIASIKSKRKTIFKK